MIYVRFKGRTSNELRVNIVSPQGTPYLHLFSGRGRDVFEEDLSIDKTVKAFNGESINGNWTLVAQVGTRYSK